MTDQKAENLLNLALETPEAEREKTEELNVGYNKEERTWELIVKYSGGTELVFDSAGQSSLSRRLAEEFPQVRFTELLGGFGILTVPESQVDAVIRLPEIEYAEKPKRLFFAVNEGRAASCMTAVQTGADGLTGNGILMAVIDSGLDLFHEDFRNLDGSTRVLWLMDQVTGRVYTKEEIDGVLMETDSTKGRGALPGDFSGHGTAVTGIAAGNGRESGGRYRGVAYESDLLMVRLGAPDPDGFPRTTELMRGLDFVFRKAEELARPMVVNLSFGNTYGPHDGSGLLERYIDSMAERGTTVIVVGSGNEGDAGGHISGVLEETKRQAGGERPIDISRPKDVVIELSVAPYESGFGLQLWKQYEDDFEIYLVNPARSRTEKVIQEPGTARISFGETKLLVFVGEPSPFSEAQEIYFDFIPGDSYVESGIWNIILRPLRIVTGQYHFWLPSAGAIGNATRFLRPTPDVTLTIPSTASRPITVGAYDDSTLTYAAFSGRGGSLKKQGIWDGKPDLSAPGVSVITTRSGGGYAPVTGTSFAAPFVAGAAALMMEWGIIRGNDPYLYGDKMKAYLKKGARPLPGDLMTPNSQTGYGALCVRDSLPM